MVLSCGVGSGSFARASTALSWLLTLHSSPTIYTFNNCNLVNSLCTHVSSHCHCHYAREDGKGSVHGLEDKIKPAVVHICTLEPLKASNVTWHGNGSQTQWSFKMLTSLCCKTISELMTFQKKKKNQETNSVLEVDPSSVQWVSSCWHLQRALHNFYFWNFSPHNIWSIV